LWLEDAEEGFILLEFCNFFFYPSSSSGEYVTEGLNSDRSKSKVSNAIVDIIFKFFLCLKYLNTLKQ
jgi:hypothetical protein